MNSINKSFNKLWQSLLISIFLVSLNHLSYAQSAPINNGTLNFGLTSASLSQLSMGVNWPFFGNSIVNSSYNPHENILTSATVPYMVPKWIYQIDTMTGISARPAVVDNIVYFPDWGGNLQALNANDGSVIWKHNMDADYSQPGKTVGEARATPAIFGNTIYLASNSSSPVSPPNGAVMMAINRDDGTLRWSTLLDSHPLSKVDQSAMYYKGVVYVGVASSEETASPFCMVTNTCSFRGSFNALDAKTGKILWKTYMTTPAFTGAAVWGSTPVIDVKRNSIYIGTGNNYTGPAQDDPNNLDDAIVALDLDTGAVKWATKLSPTDSPDIWTLICKISHLSCGPDADFGQGPMLYTVKINGVDQDMLAAGQKSGVLYALNPDSGQVIWYTSIGPGNTLGGMEWGSATDGNRIYVANSNIAHVPITLVNPSPGSPAVTTNALWAAVDAISGKIIWQTADPNSNDLAAGPVAVAGDVVYAGSANRLGLHSGYFYAFNASDGSILWSYPTMVDDNDSGAVLSGATIVNGTVYWGSGYLPILSHSHGNKFYAFALPSSQ